MKPIAITRKTSDVSISALVAGVKSGKYHIPIFQRDFEWSAVDVCNLLVSILKDIDIGKMLIWKSEKSYQNRQFCDMFNQPVTTDNLNVLDGHQKLTSFYQMMEKKGFGESIFINVESYKLYTKTRNPNIQIAFVGKSTHSTSKLINVCELFDKRLQGSVEKDPTLKELRDKFLNYEVSTTTITGPTSYAVDQFVASNTSGKDLVPLTILNCKFIDDMNLEEMMWELHNSLKLSTTISFVEGAQPLKLLLDSRRSISKSRMYTLDASTVLEKWPALVDAYQSADEYLTKHWRIKKIRSSRFMYHVIAYYFYYGQFSKVQDKHKKDLDRLVKSSMFTVTKGQAVQDNINSHLQSNFQLIEHFIDDGVLDMTILSKKDSE